MEISLVVNLQNGGAPSQHIAQCKARSLLPPSSVARRLYGESPPGHVLCVEAYVRNFSPPPGSRAIWTLLPAAGYAGPEWSRFVSYLRAGVEGTSSPKAGVLTIDGGCTSLVVAAPADSNSNELGIIDMQPPNVHETDHSEDATLSASVDLHGRGSGSSNSSTGSSSSGSGAHLLPLQFTPAVTDADLQPLLESLFAVLETSDDAEAASAVLDVMRSSSDDSQHFVDASDASGKDHLTPLMKAAKHGRVNCTELLLRQYSASVNCVSDRSRYTAIGLAAYCGSRDIVELLLSHGADPRIANRYLESAMRVAEARGHASCSAILRARAAQLDAADAAAGGSLSSVDSAPSPPIEYTLRTGARVCVRCVLPSDQASVVDLYTAAQRGYMQHEVGGEGDAAIARADAVHGNWLSTVLSTDFADVAGHYGALRRGRFWVAELLPVENDSSARRADLVSPRIIGCVAVVPFIGQHSSEQPQQSQQSAGSAPDADTAELQRMACHPSLQRCGLASILLKHAESWAAHARYARMHLSTLESMRPAMALYPSRGYSQMGRVERLSHGQTLCIAHFEKRLSGDDAAASCSTTATSAVVAGTLVPAAAPAQRSGEAAAAATTAVTTSTTATAAAAKNTAAPLRVPLPAPLPSSDGHGHEYVPRHDVANARGPALDEIVARVTAAISSGSIPFPYKASYTSLKQVEAWFKELCDLPSSRSLSLGTYELHGFVSRGQYIDCRTDAPLIVDLLPSPAAAAFASSSSSSAPASTVGGGGITWRLSSPALTVGVGSGGPVTLEQRATTAESSDVAMLNNGGSALQPSIGAIEPPSQPSDAPTASADTLGTSDTATAPASAATSGAGSGTSSSGINVCAAAVVDPWDGRHIHVTSLLGIGCVSKPFDAVFNDAGGHIVDYFSEGARMEAYRRDADGSPALQWRREAVAKRIVEKAIRKHREVTAFSLRHGAYGNVAACNLFHANLARALFDLLGAKRILDPCAGWGDRLVGALATRGVSRYLGFDPNPALVGPHAAIVGAFRTLAPATAAGVDVTAEFNVVCAPFEDGVIPAADAAAGFNVVLTSPPYFDLEVYSPAEAAMGAPVRVGDAASTSSSAAAPSARIECSAAAVAIAVVDADAAPSSATSTMGPSSTTTAAQMSPTQSISRHGSSLSRWLHDWYFPMMSKAWDVLTPGGHMAIYINDHEEEASASSAAAAAVAGMSGGSTLESLEICVPMLRHAATLPGSMWVGVLGITGETGKVRPLWVWRKGPLGPAPPPPLYSTIAELIRKQQVAAGASSSSSIDKWIPPHRRQPAAGLPPPPPPPSWSRRPGPTAAAPAAAPTSGGTPAATSSTTSSTTAVTALLPLQPPAEAAPESLDRGIADPPPRKRQVRW